MPIHDQGYRRYGGNKAQTGTGWTVIARAGIRTMVSKKAFLGLLLIAWLPFFVRAIQIYLATAVAQAATLIPVTAETFRDFLDGFPQHVIVYFVTVYVGAGLIANDRRANALQIYLSKPLLRSEYIIGKLAVLFTFLTLVTFVPAITIGAFLQVALASFTMLALSSLSKSARYVGILYVGITFFTSAIYGALYAITGNSRIAWIGVTNNVAQVVDVVFRQKPSYQTPWQVSLLVILGLVAVSISILERRVRGVEVVT